MGDGSSAIKKQVLPCPCRASATRAAVRMTILEGCGQWGGGQDDNSGKGRI
jgi:hypothetical protein